MIKIVKAIGKTSLMRMQARSPLLKRRSAWRRVSTGWPRMAWSRPQGSVHRRRRVTDPSLGFRARSACPCPRSVCPPGPDRSGLHPPSLELPSPQEWGRYESRTRAKPVASGLRARRAVTWRRSPSGQATFPLHGTGRNRSPEAPAGPSHRCRPRPMCSTRAA